MTLFTIVAESHNSWLVKDPDPLLANPALLPLAVLAQTDSPARLLEEVAARVELIEEPQQQRDISAYTEILAFSKV